MNVVNKDHLNVFIVIRNHHVNQKFWNTLLNVNLRTIIWFKKKILKKESIKNQFFLFFPVYISDIVERYVCDICHKSYKRKPLLNRHKKYECINTGQFACPKCGKASNQKHNMIEHFRKCKSKMNKKSKPHRK